VMAIHIFRTFSLAAKSDLKLTLSRLKTHIVLNDNVPHALHNDSSDIIVLNNNCTLRKLGRTVLFVD